MKYDDRILQIAKKFNITTEPLTFRECTDGHINGTYFIYDENGKRYVLQRINTSVFKNPDILMENIFGVTSHIRGKLNASGGDARRGTLNFLTTVEGAKYFRDEDGSCWRLYDYIGGVVSYQSADSPKLFERVGRAFGHFQMQLADYDTSKLEETIPDFHNTPVRFNTFCEAVRNDAASRAREVPDDIQFVLERKTICSYITDRINAGILPLRVTHNDTKLNNILMDKATGTPVCVIDLDTVMPGSVLFDFGDAIRFGASSAAEDETDLTRVFMREDMFEAFARGFIGGLDGSLTDAEILDLPMGAMIITLETGIRFLTDYLNGDTYFRIHYPKQNLDRARNQFALVRDMEKKMRDMLLTVKKYI